MNYSHGYIVGRAASGALWFELWEHSEYDDGMCVYDTFPCKFRGIYTSETRAQLLQAGMALKTGELVKLIARDGQYVPAAQAPEEKPIIPEGLHLCACCEEHWTLERICPLCDHESEKVPKPYSTPRLSQLVALPLKPVGSFVTIWEFHEALTEWDFTNLYNLYDILCLARRAKVSLDAMIGLIGHDIAQAFEIGAQNS